MRTSSVAVKHGTAESQSDRATAGSSRPQMPAKSSEDRPMSAKKRNEMLAQGRCFTCEEVGHLARNCPKTTNVVSRQKGKPPGFGLHAARFSNARDSTLYESTQVLDTLPVGAVGLTFDAAEVVEEGGMPTENLNEISDELFEQEVEHSPPSRPIGDLYAFNAQLALEMGQPYPGDDAEFNHNERRFCVYRISDSQYVVMDSMVDYDCLIDDEHLQNSGFMLSLWYARERQQAIGLDPRDVPMEDRYLAELGDALIIGARVMLEQANWDGSENDSDFSRFHTQDAQDGLLTIMDLPEEIQFLLPRAQLLDQSFDLMAWYRSELEECKRQDADYVLASLSESEAEMLTYESSTDSDMPPLESILDSDSEGEHFSVPTTVVHDNGKKFPRRLKPHRQLGDLLEDAVRVILEVSQPYPGDERAPHDERRHWPRFHVVRVSYDCYLIRDDYFLEISILPLEYLREPTFSLGCWYADIRAIECEIEEFEFLRTHRATIKELLADEVRRYLTENSETYPILGSTSVSRMLRDPDDLEGPDFYLVAVAIGLQQWLKLNPQGIQSR